MCKTNSVSDFSSPHLFFPQIHTNTSTQTNQHKDTQTHPHEQTNKERERDWCWCWLLVDRWIGAGGGDQSLWVDGNGSGCLWIRPGGGDWCLWVDGVSDCGLTEIGACGLWVLILVVLVVES